MRTVPIYHSCTHSRAMFCDAGLGVRGPVSFQCRQVRLLALGVRFREREHCITCNGGTKILWLLARTTVVPT